MTKKRRLLLEITEKDLFLYVFDPVKLDSEKFKYIENSCEKYKNELNLLISMYKLNLSTVDKEIIIKILKKINTYDEGVYS